MKRKLVLLGFQVFFLSLQKIPRMRKTRARNLIANMIKIRLETEPENKHF